MRDDSTIHHMDIDITVCNLYAVYQLVGKDVGGTNGLVGVRVLAEDIPKFFEGLCDKASSDFEGV